MKYTIKEEIGSHFLDHAVEQVKLGKQFCLFLDNIDWDVKAHDVRSNKQNQSVHAVATLTSFKCALKEISFSKTIYFCYFTVDF